MVNDVNLEFIKFVLFNAACIGVVANVTVSMLKGQLKDKLKLSRNALYIMALIAYIIYTPVWFLLFTTATATSTTMVICAWCAILMGQSAYKIFEYYYGKSAIKLLSSIGIEVEDEYTTE